MSIGFHGGLSTWLLASAISSPLLLKTMSDRNKKVFYMPRIRIPYSAKHKLNMLQAKTGLSLSMLCLKAIEAQYHIKLTSSQDDKNE